MNIYTLKGCQNFINLLEIGKIAIEFKIRNYYDKKKYGMVHSHEIAFAIKEEDLTQLFDLYQ